MSGGYLAPTQESLAKVAELPEGQPIQMLNFLRFRAKAEYPADHSYASRGWSGERAYQQYGAEITGPLSRAKARVIWQNTALGTIIGPDGEAWDSILVVEYPSAKAFLTMISDPEYLEGAANRTAALDDSRLYLTQPTKR